MFLWRLATALLVVYIILLCMRFLLGWFGGGAGRYWRLLLRLTDPYLRLFRGMGFLRRGPFDFTAVAAVLVLVVVLDLATAFSSQGRVTLGLALGTLAGAAWAGLSFLLVLFIVLAALRLLSRLLARRYDGPVGQLLEAMVRPVLNLARELLPGWKEVALLLGIIAALVAAHLLAGLLFRLLRAALLALPF